MTIDKQLIEIFSGFVRQPQRWRDAIAQLISNHLIWSENWEKKALTSPPNVPMTQSDPWPHKSQIESVWYCPAPPPGQANKHHRCSAFGTMNELIVACIRICMVDACVIYLMSGLAHNNFCNSVPYGLAQLLLLAYTLHEHKQQRRSKSKKTNQRFICFVCLSFCFVSSINLSMHWTSTGDYWFLIQTFFFSDCTFLNHSKPASTIGTKLTYTILHAQIITMKTNLEKQRNAKIIQK